MQIFPDLRQNTKLTGKWIIMNKLETGHSIWQRKSIKMAGY
jgi:hypothetical protein